MSVAHVQVQESQASPEHGASLVLARSRARRAAIKVRVDRQRMGTLMASVVSSVVDFGVFTGLWSVRSPLGHVSLLLAYSFASWGAGSLASWAWRRHGAARAGFAVEEPPAAQQVRNNGPRWVKLVTIAAGLVVGSALAKAGSDRLLARPRQSRATTAA